MEVINKRPAWLDPSHPNFIRWERARKLSLQRGELVKKLVEQKLKVKNLRILDLGSGEGGTAKIFSQNNFVVSFDLNLIRLRRQQDLVVLKNDFSMTKKSFENNMEDFSGKDSFEMTTTKLVNGTALQLPFSNHSFDLIIIQDVIEHLSETESFFQGIKRVLKPGGIIYLSTPNKFSIINFISDPHFGLPIVSILKRKSIKKYFLRRFRKYDANRNDVAQLLSLNDMIYLVGNDYNIKLNTKFIVEKLFDGNKGIVWSNFHLKLISISRFLYLDRMISKIANDQFGIINKYFTPSFYFLIEKK